MAQVIYKTYPAVPAPDPDAIALAQSTVGTDQPLTLVGGSPHVLPYPGFIYCTSTFDPETITINGEDEYGNVISETLIFSSPNASTTKVFKVVTSVIANTEITSPDTIQIGYDDTWRMTPIALDTFNNEGPLDVQLQGRGLGGGSGTTSVLGTLATPQDFENPVTAGGISWYNVANVNSADITNINRRLSFIRLELFNVVGTTTIAILQSGTSYR